MQYRRYPLTLAIAGLTLALSGCFGGSSPTPSSGNGTSATEDSVSDPDNGEEQPTDDDTQDDPVASNVMTPTSELEGEQTGQLIDGAVDGLNYWTATEGKTDDGSLPLTNSEGEFTYSPGEIVVFYFNGNPIIVTDAEKYVTPMDNLSWKDTAGDGDPHVGINILRLLQSVDEQPDNDSQIVVPDVYSGTGTSDFEIRLNTFIFEQQLDSLLEMSGNSTNDIAAYDFASLHFEQSLRDLKRSDHDLQGEWIVYEGRMENYLDGFEDSSCNLEHRGGLIIEEDTAFRYGNELSFLMEGADQGTCQEKDWSNVVDEWADRFEIRRNTRDTIEGEVEGKEWDIARHGIGEFDCETSKCSMDELRTTADNVDGTCLATDGSLETGPCDGRDFYSDALSYHGTAYSDRLGGDRIIKIKRYFESIYEPEELVSGADNEWEQKRVDLKVWDRAETKDYTLDVESGEWNERWIRHNDQEEFLEESANIASLRNAPDCVDSSACTWDELNSSSQSVNFIHVRGTDVINWVTDDEVGTIYR